MPNEILLDVIVLDFERDSKIVLLRGISDTSQQINTETKIGIFLNVDAELITLKIDTSTILMDKKFDNNEEIYIIARLISPDESITLAIFNRESLLRFSCNTLAEKLAKMREFAALPENFKKIATAQLSLPRQTEDDFESCELPRDLPKLKSLFSLCRDHYSKEVQHEANAILKQLDGYVSSSEKANLIDRLRGMLVSTYIKPPKNRTFDELIAILDKHIYGMKQLKNMVAEQCLVYQHSNAPACRILLVGSPGVGKSSVLKSIAQCFDLPLATIDCNGASTISFKGLVSSYDKAKMGKIARAFVKHSSTNIVLALEELDKALDSQDDCVYDSLLELVVPESRLYDEYIGVSLDTRASIIIATANSLEPIPDYIINRFTVLHMEDYTHADKSEIAKRYILPNLMHRLRIRCDKVIFTDDALNEIAKLCNDNGAREMHDYCEAILRHIIADWSRNLIPASIVVDSEYVAKYFQEYGSFSTTKKRAGFI